MTTLESRTPGFVEPLSREGRAIVRGSIVEDRGE
jgi:hypothetical protein